MIRRIANSSSGAPRGRPRPRPPQPAEQQRAGEPLTMREKLGWLLTFLVVGCGLLWVLWPVFSLLFGSAALAYVLSPLVRRMEARGRSRTTSVLALFTTGAAGVLAFGLLLVPAIAEQFSVLSGNVQDYLQRAASAIGPAVQWVERHSDVHIPVDLPALQAEVPGWISKLSPDARSAIQSFLSGLFTSSMGFVLGVVNLLLVPVFTFYLLRDWEDLMSGLGSLIPLRHRARVTRIASEVDGRLSAFVQGQITLCLALGLLYSVGLWVAQIDLPFVIGMTAGILFIIPYFGPAVGLVLSLLLALLKYGVDAHLAYVLMVFFGVQGLEGWLLTPVLVGDKVGLHPMVVMVALIVGGSLLGLWGMVLAIPLAAVADVLLREWITLYRGSAMFQGRP